MVYHHAMPSGEKVKEEGTVAEGYILVVAQTQRGLRVYVLPCTRDQIKKFWDFWKGRR